MFELTGKTAVITGASRGIGKAIAVKFASLGANIAFLHYCDAENAAATEKELNEMGIKAKGYECNVADFEASKKAVDEIIADFGEVHILVNNAGIVRDCLVLSMKEADFDGDVNLDLSRCSGEVDKVFGGSYNANVRGNVTINITSGIYTSVYGGNDRKGTIGGNIIINIEEVDQCNPIIIQNLFGGGSQADYPGTGALTYIGTKPKPNPETTPETNPSDYSSFTSGSITINIKAATRIDRVFGGCDNAKATSNTAVNINMVKGSLAGNGFTRPATYTGDPIPNMHTGDAYAVVSGLIAGESDVNDYYTRTGSTYTKASGKALENTTYYQYLTGISYIDNAIGTIGSVYGGGNQGDVDGNTTVNIGTLKDITFVKTPEHLTPKTKENLV